MYASYKGLITYLCDVVGWREERKEERKGEKEEIKQQRFLDIGSCHLSKEMWVCSRKKREIAPLLPSPSDFLPGGTFLLVFNSIPQDGHYATYWPAIFTKEFQPIPSWQNKALRYFLLNNIHMG